MVYMQSRIYSQKLYATFLRQWSEFPEVPLWELFSKCCIYLWLAAQYLFLNTHPNDSNCFPFYAENLVVPSWSKNVAFWLFEFGLLGFFLHKLVLIKILSSEQGNDLPGTSLLERNILISFSSAHQESIKLILKKWILQQRHSCTS